MKKLLITLIVSGFTAATFAQGTVLWTGVAGQFMSQTNSTVYSPYFGGGAVGFGGVGNTVANTSAQYYYELLVSPTLSTVPTTLTGLSSWLDTGLEAQNSAGNSGRILQLNASTDTVANNWPAGATENLIMVGWSANLGSTWSSALNHLENWDSYQALVFNNAFFGVGSSVGTLLIGNANPGISVFGTFTGAINNGVSNPLQMDLLPTPEPGTLALTALGGLSLLAFRRKK